MILRAWLTSVLALLAGLLSLLSANLTYAQTRPPAFIYNCLDNGFGTCTFQATPPFDSCGGFATWYCATHPPPPGDPCTFTEILFNGPFGERGKQCIGAARSIALPDCGDGWQPTIPNSVDTLCVPNADFKRKEAQLAKPRCCVGDPINPAPSVGNNFVLETDYVGTGPFPLRLEHYYNSAGTKIYPGMFGLAFAMANWRHSYERSISFSVAQGISFARVMLKDGRWIYFNLVGSTWTPEEPDIVERLEQVVENGQTIWKFTNLDDEIERYDALGRLSSITNRAGLTQTVVNDALNRVTSVSDPFGKTLTFNYGAANCDPVRCVASVQDPNGNLIQFGYTRESLFGNTVFRLKTVTYPGTATPRTYNYEDTNDAFALIELIDENGASTTWSYAGGRAGSSQHAGGAEKVTLEYLSDTSTRVTATISDGATPVTRVDTYQFQRIHGIDQVTAITGDACPSCGPKTMQYDANGYRSQITDWNDNVTTYLRQDATRVDLETQRVEAFGTPQARTINTTWHSAFRLPTLIAEPGRTTSMAYDATTGNLLTRTITDTALSRSRTWTYTYNANGQVLTMDGPRTDVSDVTTYTYYANDDADLGKRGNIATITNALNHVTQITAYNAHGQPLSIVDPNGLTTTLGYDPRQRLTSRNVGGELTSYAYDAVGKLTRVTMPDSSFLNYTYDAAHRLTQIDDSLGNRIVYTLDTMGNRTQEQVFDPVNALAQTRSRVYSNLNRLAQEIGAAGQTTAYTYDNQGNLTSIDGPLAGTVDVTTNSYDALNRLTSMTDPNTGQVNYGYNALDQMTSVADPRTLTTSYAYDALNNLNQLQSPDTGVTQNTYDNAGNLLTQIDAKGQTTTYTYDALNRVASISYATDASLNVTFQYDLGANGKGRLTGVTDSTGTLAYAYDQKGRLTSETRVINAVNYVTAYSYDTAGRLTGITYPSGRQVTYTLDALGRIYAITTTKDGVPQTVLSNADYRPFGPLRAFTFGNGQNYIRGFDSDGRVYGYTLGNQSFVLGFDAASRITSIGELGNSANTNGYSYDNLDRLTQATLPSTLFGYSYDLVGNRLSRTVGAANETYTYGTTNNRLASLTPLTGPVRNFVFDANGSTTNDAINQFTFDARGRLTQANSVVGLVQYRVNSLGQRIRKTSPSADTVYHYDSGGRLIAESSAGGVVRAEYIYLGDIPVAVVR